MERAFYLRLLGAPESQLVQGIARRAGDARGEATRAIWHLESFVASNPELEVRQEVDAMIQTLKEKKD